MIYNNILEAVGHTPMIRLNRMVDEDSAQILVKFEGVNVGGSIKTRTALNMILEAEKRGLLNKDSIIVEPTSGNQGIGLALVGAVKGYRTIIIMPDSVSEERRKLVRHYGAEVKLIHDAGDIGACIDECLQTALKMQEKNPNIFVPQQFANRDNIMAHKNHTALEIMEQVAGPIHGFCSGIGTGGTITGIGEVLKAQNPDIEIWAVEPENAAILAGGTIGTHLQMGIGDGIIPDILNQNIYDEVYIITDEEALNTSKRLAKEEGLMCGICNGFQALIKLGLVPYGKIIDTDENCPTLSYNTISRHQSKIVGTKLCSNNSPWLKYAEVGKVYNVPISHGEGRIIASDDLLMSLAENGQILTQYVDLDGNPTSDIQYNPNGSALAVEGLLSLDGRVFGKMGHAERIGTGLYKNVPGDYDLKLFESAVAYYNQK